MARPREFDREEVLRLAIQVFWEKGFGGASTDDLVRAMGIGRQSLYDTFGDKRSLFLQALAVYSADGVAAVVKKLRAGPNALRAIERVLLDMAEERGKTRIFGCMGVNAICELAQTDPEVRSVIATSAMVLESALADVIEEGAASGELRSGIDARAAARFIAATLSGLKVQAKAGASTETLREIAAFACASLRAA